MTQEAPPPEDAVQPTEQQEASAEPSFLMGVPVHILDEVNAGADTRELLTLFPELRTLVLALCAINKMQLTVMSQQVKVVLDNTEEVDIAAVQMDLLNSAMLMAKKQGAVSWSAFGRLGMAMVKLGAEQHTKLLTAQDDSEVVQIQPES